MGCDSDQRNMERREGRNIRIIFWGSMVWQWWNAWQAWSGHLIKEGPAIQKFRAISERLCLLEVDGLAHRFSIIAVYMPHGGYKDDVVEAVYMQLSVLFKEARELGRIIVLGGDLNAEVQSRECGEASSVGQCANICGNERGEWLESWATREHMVVANTVFRKRWGKVWTHIQKSRKRQIDYRLVERKRRRHVIDASATKLVSLGSDHRGVRMVFDIGPKSMKKRRPYSARTGGSNIGWRPKCIDSYRQALDECLHTARVLDDLYWRSKSIDERLAELEASVVKTAALCRKIEVVISVSREKDTDEVKMLIKERRDLEDGENMKLKRADISKKIQRAIQRDLRQSSRD